MKKSSVRTITHISPCVAVLAVMSMITIPTGAVPITLQTFAVALTGAFLGAKRGSIAVLVYVLIGAVGVPVFSGFQGGAGVLFGYSGGFIWGFFPLAFLCGTLRTNRAKIPLGLMGVLICHFLGVLQYTAVSGVGLFTSIFTVSLPYLLKDFAFVIAAIYVARILRKRIVK